MTRDHRKLRAFELADELVLMVYRLTRQFPTDERFGLCSQMRRAAVSVPANIVEGCARPTESDYLRFLHIAFASLRELGYYIDLTQRLQYVETESAAEIDRQYQESAIVLNALIQSLQRQ